MEELKSTIRDVPDFPKKGIIFKDITTLLGDKVAFKKAIDCIVEKYKDEKIDVVAGLEARGFITGAPLAYALGAAFVPVRKPGKLPYKTNSESYELEYGTNTIEIHQDAISEGQRVLISDDLLATGGTAGAAIKLISEMKAEIVGVSFLIELGFLNGKEKLNGLSYHTLITY